MTDYEKLELLDAAADGNVSAVSDMIDTYGADHIRNVMFWDLKVFSPFDEDIRAVFHLFGQTAALIRAIDIYEKPNQLTDDRTLAECLAETDFFDEHEANAFFRLLTEAAIKADIKGAIIALMDERRKRGL